MPKAKKRTRRVEKRTSARVASDAGKLVRLSRSGHFYWSRRPLIIDDREAKDWKLIDELVESVAGSALVQKLPKAAKKRAR